MLMFHRGAAAHHVVRPQMSRALALVALLPIVHASTGTFESAETKDDQRTLTITRTNGQESEAPRILAQVGFEKPAIAPDKSHVGWLALHPGCCTSYPIPLTLVIQGTDGRLRRFSGSQAIFGWCFTPDARSVAYRQEAPHGPTAQTFELRSISSGRLIRRFVRSWDYQAQELSSARLPSWAVCAAD